MNAGDAGLFISAAMANAPSEFCGNAAREGSALMAVLRIWYRWPVSAILSPYALPAVRVKDVTVMVCPDVTTTASSVMSPPPPVIVAVPWAWQVVPSDA